MVLTVRLRGLPPTADVDHIQFFFTGLKIQKEGINIIGGEHGEAVVTFVDNCDVVGALRRSGRCLLDCPIQVSVEYDSLYSPGYVSINYRPLDATLADIKEFFKEFSVESVFFCKQRGVNSGTAIVKFEKNCDAEKVLSALPRKQHPKTSEEQEEQKAFIVLSGKRKTEKTWAACVGRFDSEATNKASDQVQASKNQVTPAGKQLQEIPTHKQNLLSIYNFYAHLVNVSPLAHKSLIRQFFSNRVDDSQITLLYDKGGKRQLEYFVMFVTEEDYVQALMLDKSLFLGHRVRVLPVTKNNMMEILENNKKYMKEKRVSKEKMKTFDIQYFYLRNFAACANKLDVLNFFAGFSVTDKDICMLYDEYGNSLGEALVKLSKRESFMATQLHRKRFQDTEILVRLISKKQLRAFGVHPSLDPYTPDWRCSKKMDVCGADVCVTEEDDPPEVTCDM